MQIYIYIYFTLKYNITEQLKSLVYEDGSSKKSYTLLPFDLVNHVRHFDTIRK